MSEELNKEVEVDDVDDVVDDVEEDYSEDLSGLENEPDDDDEGEESPPPQSYRTQEEVNKAIEARLNRERRKLAKMFGVKDLEEVTPYLEAGQAVTRASGLNPREVVSRMSGYTSQSQQQQQHSDPDVNTKLQKIERMLEENRKNQSLQKQEAEAKKEFGDLFDQSREEIEDRAEELGLALVDAAAIVLRPKMKEHLSTQQQKKQELRKKRKVDGSDGAPTKKSSPSSKLSEQQKKIAAHYGISEEAYYNQLKRRGKIE